MDKRYKVALTVLRTLILLGTGTAGMVHELFYKPNPSGEVLIICAGFVLGEALISAWILQKFAPSGTEQASQHQEP